MVNTDKLCGAELTDAEYWEWYYGELAKYHEWSRHYKIEYLKMNMDLVQQGLDLEIITMDMLLTMFTNDCCTLNEFSFQFQGDKPAQNRVEDQITHEAGDYSDVIELLTQIREFGREKSGKETDKFKRNHLHQCLGNIQSCLRILGIEPEKDPDVKKIILKH